MADDTAVKLQFLGTASAPSATRNYSSLLVKLDAKTSVMVDCGEGTQQQFIKIGGGETKLGSITTILVTHLHQDHVAGIAPLLNSLLGPSSAPSTDEVGARGASPSAYNADLSSVAAATSRLALQSTAPSAFAPCCARS